MVSRSVLLAALAAASLLGCGSGSAGPGAGAPVSQEPEPTGPDPLSNQILQRDAQANRSMVKHIVVGEEKKELALDLLRRVRAGEPIEPLMAEFSTDPGSADNGEPYEVRPDAELVFEFKRLGLRLQVGEAGIVQSRFGWHVMKRIE